MAFHHWVQWIPIKTNDKQNLWKKWVNVHKYLQKCGPNFVERAYCVEIAHTIYIHTVVKTGPVNFSNGWNR